MTSASRPPQKFRLSASNVAKFFANRCERYFRWNTVAGPLRGRPGIGWNVPPRMRAHTRPGVAMLMEAGNDFEGAHVEQLIAEHGEAVLTAGVERDGGRCKVRELPFASLAEALRREPLPRFAAQLEVALDPEQEARLLARFNLDPARFTLAPARPDLLEVITPDGSGGDAARLRIWDFKASQQARHDHYVQVAYYSFVLEHAISEAGLNHVEVDTEFAVIRSRKTDDPPFELRPYRLAVEDFLRNRAPAILATPAADTHFHVAERCAMCEYMDQCRAEADAHFDLSRVAYMSSESKRRLRAAGVGTHRELATLPGGRRVAELQTLSHDLSLNLARYVEAARALEDGLPRPLQATTLMMPRREDVRVVIAAEQDAVTGTCFALGFKTFEGWDAEAREVKGDERIFVAREPDSEARILLEFLRALNELLRRTDAANRAVLVAESIDEDPAVRAANEESARCEESLAEFKRKCPVLRKTNPRYEELSAEREALKAKEREAKAAIKKARGDSWWEMRKRTRSLHFYVYDGFDLHVLRSLVERHLFTEDAPELLAEITHLLRLFPPPSVMQDAETFRTVPGTVVTQVLRTLVALPAPYSFDLRTVSETYQPTNAGGEERGYAFRPRYGFGWDFSSQLAFERIHDVWRGEAFSPDPRDPARDIPPAEVLRLVEETLRTKLRATDSVVRRLKQDFRDQLLLRKEPFLLYGEFDPLNFRTLEALRAFAILETSLAELAVKGLHSLPAEDRAGKFVCVRGLRFVEGSEQEDGSLWFTFDPACRDAKFDAGDFNLVVTPEARPDVLLNSVDGRLFDSNWGRAAPFKVTLKEYDTRSDPPRVRLLPDSPDKFKEQIDLSEPLALDQLFTDFTLGRVLAVLGELQQNPHSALHVHDLLRDGRVGGWRPVVEDAARAEKTLRECAERAGRDAGALLNEGQWRAWRGVFREPLTLIWGPPGTGKTHTVAHILAGYALAARAEGRQLRVLVTAFTHHAIVNVLRKLSELAEAYGIDAESLAVVKLTGGNAADEELPARVERIAADDLEGCLRRDAPCVVAGATVWGTYKAMKKAGGVTREWFDVVLVDEASQMRLPDALVALGASKRRSNIILAGDDMQLPPIIHGTYPEEHEHMLSSVFAFMRNRIEAADKAEPGTEARTIFQLEENFRMNEPLTAYPRGALYRGRFRSTRPGIRISTEPEIDPAGAELIDAILHPARPVVLCWYDPPRSFTARNPVEAELVAVLADTLSRTLLREEKGGRPRPYTPEEFVSRGLAVLSPHRAQNSAIRQALARRGFGGDERPMPLVDTVEKMQGKEREVVLVSYGVADGEYAEAEAQFLLSRNRFNVAATRAERKLVVLCSSTVLDAVPSDRRTLLEAMMLKEFRHYCADGSARLPWASSEGDEVTLNVQWKGF